MILALLVAGVVAVLLRRRGAARREPATDFLAPGAGPRGLPRRRWSAAAAGVALAAAVTLVGAPAWAQAFDCKAPPEPDRPGSGLVGSLDPAPLGVGAPGSAYDEVGYAGQVWWTYDLGCGPGAATDPAAATDTWLGNQMFDVAKIVVGAVNWAHYLLGRGSGLFAPIDGAVQTATRTMYDAVFTTWAGVALAVLAVILLVLAMRGELSGQARRAGVAVVALALAAAAYAAPVQWSHALDGVLLDGVTDMQQGFLAPVGAGDAHTLPTVLTDQVVYTTWLRGEFGSADVPQARQFGRPLLSAQAFSKREVAAGRDGAPEAQAKKEQFGAVAGGLGDRYPYLQGRSGSRTGAGVLALVQAACIALFQLMSKLLVLVSMLVIRLLVMLAPALAVVAFLRPEVLRAVLRVGGAALVNTLLVGALAGLHSLLVIALFRPGSGVDTWLGLLVTGVVTVVLWAVARPFRRLASLVTLTRDQVTGLLPDAGGSGALSRVLDRLRGDGATGTGAGGTGAGATAAGASRPERSAPVEAAPRRVDAEVVRPDPSPAPSRVIEAGEPVRMGSRAGGGELERALYRRGARSEATTTRPAPVDVVDGIGTKRLYRPGPDRSRRERREVTVGGSGADPD